MTQRYITSLLLWLCLFPLCSGAPAWAQRTERMWPERTRPERMEREREERKEEEEEDDGEFYNPLDMKERDPLIPLEVFNERRSLSTQEQAELGALLGPMALMAANLYDGGQTEEAFELWYREARLRRFLGPLAEVEALGRLGEVAWNENRTEDVVVVRERLQGIQEEATKGQEKSQLDRPLYTALGQAYARIRARYDALAMYEFILADVRATGDLGALEQTLNLIGVFHKGWFDFLAAARVYEELLALAQGQFDVAGERRYLEELVYIYDESRQYEKAIAVKEPLLLSYAQKEEFFNKIAPVQISLGQDYLRLGEKEQAIANLEAAFNWAWDNEQWGYASNALEALAALYVQYDQLDYALQLYQEQLKAAQSTYNFYEIMTIYDRMGELYLKLNNQPQALQAFREALRFAEAIQHQEEYFEEKITDILNNFL